MNWIRFFRKKLRGKPVKTKGHAYKGSPDSLLCIYRFRLRRARLVWHSLRSVLNAALPRRYD